MKIQNVNDTVLQKARRSLMAKLIAYETLLKGKISTTNEVDMRMR